MNDKIFETVSSLVQFLKKQYKYKQIKNVNPDKNLIILANRIYKYQIIIIDSELTSSVTDQNQMMISQFSQKRDSVLRIRVVSNQSKSLKNIHGLWTIQTTPDNIKNDLMHLFGDINKIDMFVASTKPIEEKLTVQESNDLKVQNYNSFLAKIKNNNIFFTWIVLALFIILPAVATILGSVMGANLLFWATGTEGSKTQGSLSLGASQIVFGGTNRTLTINGGQWWRIFTYGFSAVDTGSAQLIFQVFFLFIICSALFSTSRITEIVRGSALKIAIPFILSYLTLGFIASTTMPNSITSGSLPILAIMIGILLMNVSGDKTPVSAFAKAKSVWPIAIIVLIALMSSDQSSAFAISFLGIVLGSIYGWITKKQPKDWEKTEKIMLVLLVLLVVIGIVFAIILKTVPAENNDVLAALEFYLNKNMLSQDGAHKIVNKIAWSGNFAQRDYSPLTGDAIKVWAWISNVT